MAVERKRVLVVDDDKELLNLIRVLLSRLNVDVTTAESATAAAQLLKTEPLYDLLVLDLMLPDVSGVDLLKQMRGKDMFEKLPILVLSALIDPVQIRDALDAGADRYLTKPYIANNLVSVAGEMLRTGRRTNES